MHKKADCWQGCLKYTQYNCGNEKNSQQIALQIKLRMIIIAMHFTGGSTGGEHDIAHIASSTFSAHIEWAFFSLDQPHNSSRLIACFFNMARNW